MDEVAGALARRSAGRLGPRPPMTPDGLTIRQSGFGPRETMDRLVAAVTGHGMSILARIDHAAAAATAGLALRPTEVLIFGNASAGTPLMQTAPTLGIDLPLKALVWQDEAGATWLAYNDPMWLAAPCRSNCGRPCKAWCRSSPLGAQFPAARGNESDRGAPRDPLSHGVAVSL